MGKNFFELFIKDYRMDFSMHTVWYKLYSRLLWVKAWKDLNENDKHLTKAENIRYVEENMKKRYIAMIPARLGSQRIQKKNIRYLNGKPLIMYPVDNCISCGCFDSIWINTESKELGKALENDKVSFHERPVELASNNATNRDFTYQFLKVHICDYVIMVNPTSPLLRVNTLNAFVDFVDESDFDTVFSVVSEKTECFCRGEPVNFEKAEKINSQFLTPVDKVVWALTAWKRDSFLEAQENGSNPIFGGKIGFFPIPKDESCDLDTQEDWNIAEGMLLAREAREVSEIKYMELR